MIMESSGWSSGNNHGGRRASTSLPIIMESPRGSSVIIMEIGRSSILFTRSRFFLQGVPGAQHSYPRLWRAQEGALPSSWRSAARRFNLKGVPGARPSYPRSWRAQEGALPSSWRSAASRFFHSHAHGESKRELCHQHGIFKFAAEPI